MAKQVGPILFTGTIEGIAFYKVDDEYRARKASGVSRHRLKYGKEYERTRENNAEFGSASSVARYILKALKLETSKVANRNKISMLTGRLVDVIRADKKNRRGERNIFEGDLTLMAGFEFSKSASLADVLNAAYQTFISRTHGELAVAFKSFIPADHVRGPVHCTHFQITATAVEFDFHTGRYVIKSSSTDFIDISSHEPIAITLESKLPQSKNPWFIMLGIQFFEYYGGKMRVMNRRHSNALAIVTVNTETERAVAPMEIKRSVVLIARHTPAFYCKAELTIEVQIFSFDNKRHSPGFGHGFVAYPI